MKLIALMFLLLPWSANATFVPPNHVTQITIQDAKKYKQGYGLDQKQFDQIISKVEKEYKPIVSSMGASLVIEKLWKDSTTNSETYQFDGFWVVRAYGGLARHPMMTSDGYMMVLCHELYHHLGGFPKYQGIGFLTPEEINWASNEGQSDYGAALKCFKRIVRNENNTKQINCATEKGTISACCGHKTPQDAGTCARVVRAGISTANVLHSLAGEWEPNPISLDTPDPRKVAKTFDGHPTAQIRLDTFFAGAICDANIEEPFSDFEPIAGSCAEEAGAIFGFRPRSWYAPLFIKKQRY